MAKVLLVGLFQLQLAGVFRRELGARTELFNLLGPVGMAMSARLDREDRPVNPSQPRAVPMVVRPQRNFSLAIGRTPITAPPVDCSSRVRSPCRVVVSLRVLRGCDPREIDPLDNVEFRRSREPSRIFTLLSSLTSWASRATSFQSVTKPSLKSMSSVMPSPWNVWYRTSNRLKPSRAFVAPPVIPTHRSAPHSSSASAACRTRAAAMSARVVPSSFGVKKKLPEVLGSAPPALPK